MAERTSPTLIRHVDDLWAETHELIEDAEAVERLLESAAWSAVRRVLAAEVATIDRELDHGRAKEAADYAMQHGRRGALLAFEDAAKAIIERAQARRSKAEDQRLQELAPSELAPITVGSV